MLCDFPEQERQKMACCPPGPGGDDGFVSTICCSFRRQRRWGQTKAMAVRWWVPLNCCLQGAKWVEAHRRLHVLSLKKGLWDALSGCDMAKYGSKERRGRVSDLLLQGFLHPTSRSCCPSNAKCWVCNAVVFFFFYELGWVKARLRHMLYGPGSQINFMK